MRKKNSLFSKFYIAICFAFFYLPILVTMVFSFNSSKSLSKFNDAMGTRVSASGQSGPHRWGNGRLTA